jgi:hypothetical protein
MTTQSDLTRLFPHATLIEALDDEARELLAELAELGVHVPEELARFCASIEDGSRIDLTAVGGKSRHALCDLYGVFENNHPEEGTYGHLLGEAGGPRGVILFGYGAWQLLLDGEGALGAKGAVYMTSDMVVEKDAVTLLAPSLAALLAAAKPASYG